MEWHICNYSDALRCGSGETPEKPNKEQSHTVPIDGLITHFMSIRLHSPLGAQQMGPCCLLPFPCVCVPRAPGCWGSSCSGKPAGIHGNGVLAGAVPCDAGSSCLSRGTGGITLLRGVRTSISRLAEAAALRPSPDVFLDPQEPGNAASCRLWVTSAPEWRVARCLKLGKVLDSSRARCGGGGEHLFCALKVTRPLCRAL